MRKGVSDETPLGIYRECCLIKLNIYYVLLKYRDFFSLVLWNC